MFMTTKISCTGILIRCAALSFLFNVLWTDLSSLIFNRGYSRIKDVLAVTHLQTTSESCIFRENCPAILEFIIYDRILNFVWQCFWKIESDHMHHFNLEPKFSQTDSIGIILIIRYPGDSTSFFPSFFNNLGYYTDTNLTWPDFWKEICWKKGEIPILGKCWKFKTLFSETDDLNFMYMRRA